MWTLWVRAEVNAVDAGVVPYQSVVGSGLGGVNSPYLDGLIEGGGCKHGWILGIDLDLHDVVVVIDKRVNLRPVFVPVEHFDCVVVRARDHVGLRWVHRDVSDVVCVLLNGLDLLRCVVVEDAKHVVV